MERWAAAHGTLTEPGKRMRAHLNEWEKARGSTFERVVGAWRLGRCLQVDTTPNASDPTGLSVEYTLLLDVCLEWQSATWLHSKYTTPAAYVLTTGGVKKQQLNPNTSHDISVELLTLEIVAIGGRVVRGWLMPLISEQDEEGEPRLNRAYTSSMWTVITDALGEHGGTDETAVLDRVLQKVLRFPRDEDENIKPGCERQLNSFAVLM